VDTTALTVEAEPDPRSVQLLEERLGDFNARATGVDDGEWLAIFVRGAGDELAAGLHGWTWGSCLYVRTLWVREDLRGQGLGRRLMAAAEREARRRGCERAILETLDFQAPEFYAKLGYRVTDELEGYPHAATRLLRLTKPLTGDVG
jgi:GNAT superfamily N-acetyltransferase